jgi:hypothetical protein
MLAATLSTALAESFRALRAYGIGLSIGHCSMRMPSAGAGASPSAGFCFGLLMRLCAPHGGEFADDSEYGFDHLSFPF